MTPASQVPSALDGNSRVPIYQQLAEQLDKAIGDGVLRPGDMIEPEQALAHRLRVSRVTVRKAIARLVAQGMLVRRRGHGTTVAAEPAHRRNELVDVYADRGSHEK